MEVLDITGNQTLHDSAFYYILSPIILTIWLVLARVIYSWIKKTIFCSILHLFQGNENGTLNKQPIRFKGYFKATNQIAKKWKTRAIVWWNLQLFCQELLFFSKTWITLNNYHKNNDNVSSFRLESYFKGSFQLSVSEYFGTFFFCICSRSVWYWNGNQRRKTVHWA